MWTPDVYEGAPTPVTAWISVLSKAAGIAVVLRVLQTALPTVESSWTLMSAAVALATMTVGNIGALIQSNVKRMLAYSSIAHVGYMLIGIVATSGRGTTAVLFYLLAYAVTNCVFHCTEQDATETKHRTTTRTSPLYVLLSWPIALAVLIPTCIHFSFSRGRLKCSITPARQSTK